MGALRDRNVLAAVAARCQPERVSTLIDELGGPLRLRDAVDALYDRLLADDRVAGWFVGVDMARLRAHQRKFLASAFDGPAAYSASELDEAHREVGVTDDAFSILLEHFDAVLRASDVPDSVIKAAALRLEAYRRVVIEPPAV
jgi:hemoglobin